MFMLLLKVVCPASDPAARSSAVSAAIIRLATEFASLPPPIVCSASLEGGSLVFFVFRLLFLWISLEN